MEPKEIMSGVTAGPARDEGELLRLKEDGFTRVIDLRHDEETEPLSPRQEAELLKEHGIEYLQIPVDWKSLDYERADRIRAAIHDASGPVYIHSTGGRRAAAMVVADHAIRKRLNPKDAERQAEGLGATRGGSTADVFIGQYVAERVGEDLVE